MSLFCYVLACGAGFYSSSTYGFLPSFILIAMVNKQILSPGEEDHISALANYISEAVQCYSVQFHFI